MNWLLLILGIILLLLTVRTLACLEKKKNKSLLIEIKQNLKMVPLGIVLMFLIAYIPYQIWVLFGSPVGWEILYIFGVSGVITISICFWFYSNQIKKITSDLDKIN
ncbi:hypothetical protein AWH56_011815 [Anaerobacillus isosaccharinicus]|uniref:Uncharacterized protein n=1 Tax=Anaerobacillus isosaccharinicus TaxID=1532552 RepID=A0A1S2LWC0_9BACI|nr:hypothetical protein [Anaerobacillus isosaccharinicus]MBA5588415.1 hypothetical protein [Anaerobacillus isosaccharinicus]QOY38154.1 hypothetical protein AWH56_011815 [Anaerobacillus isosaccharinicus]